MARRRLRDLLQDTWAPLSHKEAIGREGGEVREGPDWLPQPDRRRLVAYQLLKAYEQNVARAWLPDSGSDEHDDRREYGEPALLIRQTVSAVLGEEQQIVVDGVAALDEDFDPSDTDSTPEQAAEQADAVAAVERQEWLREWADLERLPIKLLECERNAVGLGDGVYLLAWSAAKRRPTVTVVDPGFYFPVLPEGLSTDYPTRVHLAWELEPTELGGPRRVRRITYELGPIVGETDVQLPTDSLRARARRLLRLGDDGSPLPQQGDLLDADGNLTRRYPWQEAGDPPSTVTCYLTEAEWELDEVDRRATIDQLTPDTATYLTNDDGQLLDRLDLRIDFLPVVHVPNTVAGADHYGQSSLSSVLQLLDEISSTDTDESAASGTTGTPPIVVSGTRIPDGLVVGPGEVWSVGENGRADMVDTSPALDALARRGDRLLARLSRNARLPQSVLGYETSGQQSGFHLLLTFGPLKALVREARLSRGEKYPLLLKMVQRLAMAGGEAAGGLPPGRTFRAELEFGAYLPTDLDSAVKRALDLYAAKAVSLETCIGMLVEAGVPVDDVAAEVRRVEQRNYTDAIALADATGDGNAVRELLGLEPVVPITVSPAGAVPPAPAV